MKVLFLFNKTHTEEEIQNIEAGQAQDNLFFGMFRLRSFGVETDFAQIEQFVPSFLVKFLRRYVLTMHYAHLPLFPLFFRYDVVFTSTAYSSLVLKAFLGIKRFKWVILDFNILGTIGERTSFRQKLFAFGVSRADGIVTISQAEKEGLEKVFPHLRGRVVFLREATSPDTFVPVKKHEDFDVVSVGNYGRDFDTLIEAVRGTSIRLLIAGKTQWSMELPENVAGKLFPQHEMKDVYARAKVVAIMLSTNPAYFDSVGTLSVGEAFAAGKATIVTRTANMESYVSDGENALFVPPGNVKAVRTAIEKLLSDEALRTRLGQNARVWAEKFLDPNLFAKGVADFLTDIVA